jgi:hypothetical protein
MLNEKKLTKAELNKREELIMKMKKNKRALVKKYGKDAEQVMYGRATNIAKKQAESMENDKLKEMVKTALQNPKAADLNKDGKLSDYEKKRGAAIEKNLDEGSSTEEKRIAMSAIKRLAKYRGVSDSEAKADLLRAVKELGDLKEEFDLDIDQEGGEQADTDKSQAGILDAEAGLGLEEDLDLGHQDNEPHMLKADLYRIGKYAMELYQMVDGFEGQGEVDFPHWWQSKIIKAKDALVGAKHYLDFEIKEPQIDAMVDVAAEEDVVDINEGVWSLGTSEQIQKAIQSLEMLQGMDVASIADSLEDDHKFYYNVIGDDTFHDELDSASRRAAMGQVDGTDISLSNAIHRAEELLAFVQKREGLKEEEAGEADMVASDIQKAMNKHKGDDVKMYQLQKARTAMNKGDLEKAKKIVARYLEEGLPKGYWDKKMDAKDEVNEDYEALVNKIKKQGKSEKAAKAIAGAVASYKAKGGGKGPTAKQKARG